MSWYTILLACLNSPIATSKPAAAADTRVIFAKMSSFKRYQSKVFWNQMETLDTCVVKLPVAATPPAAAAAAAARPKPLYVAKDEEDIFSLSGDDKFDNVDAVQDSDTDNDGLNVTVIRVELGEKSPASPATATRLPPASISPTSTSRTSTSTSRISNHSEHQRASAERSFSPLTSRSQRSQDSGFSDSGRSDDSSTGTKGSSPRRSKRRSSRRKRNSHSRRASNGSVSGLAVPQVAAVCDKIDDEDEVEATIVHTSTPKRGDLQRWSTSGRLVMEEEEEEEEEEEDGETRCHRADRLGEFELEVCSAAPETLDDFLYTADPPLDEPDNATIASSQSYRAAPPIILSLNLHAPVKSWLNELRTDIDEECTATLQSKSLPRRRFKDDEKDDSGIQKSALTAAKKIIDMADRFEAKYQRVMDMLSHPMDTKSQRELLQTLEAEATELLLKFGMQPPRRINYKENLRSISMQLGRLKTTVDRAMDQRLDFYIDKVVCSLDEATREDGITARGAVAALTALGLTGTRAGSSISRCSGIRALLTTLVSCNVKTTEPRSSILKALACCCCCLDAIDQFVNESGPELISDILNDDKTPLSVKSDVTTLLVQITSPWMDRSGLMYVEPYANDLVKALTELAVVTENSQTLLLTSAAINNLAYSSRCVGAIIKHDSIKKLLRCVKKTHNDNYGNVLMEQMAELISKVARIPQARTHLAETRASIALVCFLRMQPPGLENQRLVEKASEALTRLCVDPEIAKQVVAFTGSDCLTIIHGNNAKVMADDAGENGCDGNGNDDSFFKSTKSLRVARRIAAEQIDIARGGDDYSPR